MNEGTSKKGRRSGGRGCEKQHELIDNPPSFSQKIKSGTLKTSKARFLEAPMSLFSI
jgi:hypothetical protein